MMRRMRDELNDLPVYDTAEREWEIKLDANECSQNLPYHVLERVQDRLAFLQFNRYPDSGATELRQQIAAAYGVTEHQVLVGNGSSELLEKLFFTFGGPGKSIIYPEPSFAMYRIYAQLSGSKAVPVALDETFQLAPELVLAAARTENAALIVICTPNNPTGTVMPREALEEIIAQASCPVVIDEAYQEFYGESAADWLGKYSHLIVARTFSKAYALAAARVGYLLLSQALAGEVGKTLMPYHVNAMSQAAAEVVFMMRHEFAGRIATTVQERDNMAAVLAGVPDVTVFPSGANFVLCRVKGAAGLAAYLAEDNIGVRTFGETGPLADCIRISIGTSTENEQVIQAIQQWRKGVES